ncbi:hypothetical protein [Polaromonas hydrogenivorans]|uniref:Uncharacterized protein n=1 Tax=Polaromonas hydrogenivorans TaxID=335476 RepID=A0AAU7LYD4_9BURK
MGNGIIFDPVSVKDEDISKEIRLWRCAGADHGRAGKSALLGYDQHPVERLPGFVAHA